MREFISSAAIVTQADVSFQMIVTAAYIVAVVYECVPLLEAMCATV